MVPYGYEDFMYFVNSNFWNYHIYVLILEFLNSKQIIFKDKNKKIDLSERKIVYQKLSHKTLKEKFLYIIQNLSSFLNKRIKFFIFDTYMRKKDDFILNFRLNKFFYIFKSYKLSDAVNFKIHNNISKENQKKKYSRKVKIFENFIESIIFENIPKTFTENYKDVSKILDKNIFPKKPKLIFTTLGIGRSTIMDRYIANKVEGKTKLFLCQHGGTYAQLKHHSSLNYETKISNKFLTWGWKLKNNHHKIGIIKNIKKNNRVDNGLIIMEIREKHLFDEYIRPDTGGIKKKSYIDNCCNFFRLIKNDKIIKNLRLKLHHKTFGWEEKKVCIY